MAPSFPMPNDIAMEAAPPKTPFKAPAIPFYTRENTTYAVQNDWIGARDRQASFPPNGMASPRNSQSQASNDYFQQYMKLMNRMAYRYPNPGPPRYREGNVGSSWRHIRQVLGYSGNNLCFIDGVVKQYDLTNMNRDLAGRRPPQSRQRATPLYAVNSHDIGGFQHHMATESEKQTYKPWQPSMPPVNDTRPGYY